MNSNDQNNGPVEFNDNAMDSSVGIKPEAPRVVPHLYPIDESAGHGWLVRYSGGLIKNDIQANYVMIVLAIAGIIASGFIFFFSMRTPSPPPADKIIKVASPDARPQ